MSQIYCLCEGDGGHRPPWEGGVGDFSRGLP